MTTTHTPGPWQYSFEGGTTAFIVEPDGSTVVCMRVTENTSAHRTFTANVRLIAAAPDLLLHLQRLVRAIDRAPANFADGLADEARAAIARATGADA